MMPSISFGSREGPQTNTPKKKKKKKKKKSKDKYTSHSTNSVPTTANTTAATAAGTTTWHHKQFESLRWKYHKDHDLVELPKGMVNMAKVMDADLIRFAEDRNNYTYYRYKFKNTHYPNVRCPYPTHPIMKDRIHGLRQHHQPLAVYHYVGSLERYLRNGDTRRTPLNYDHKVRDSNYAAGDENRPSKNDTDVRWWISGWLDSFVETHGPEKAYSVLGKNYATVTTTTTTTTTTSSQQ